MKNTVSILILILFISTVGVAQVAININNIDNSHYLRFMLMIKGS